MIRAVLTDLDGVIRLWPGSDAAIESAHGLPDGAIRAVAFSKALVTPATLGQLSDAEWRERIVGALDERYPTARARAAIASWSARPGELDRRVLQLFAEHAPGARLVLVTNATSRLAEDLDALGLADRFHAVVNSSDVGVRKPAMKIFHLALRAGGITAEEALYVDDDPRNVEAALALGITSDVYQGHEALASFLRSEMPDGA